MECFYRSKPFDEAGEIRGYRNRVFRDWGECLNQQRNMCVTKQGQLKRIIGYQNLNWKLMMMLYNVLQILFSGRGFAVYFVTSA